MKPVNIVCFSDLSARELEALRSGGADYVLVFNDKDLDDKQPFQHRKGLLVSSKIDVHDHRQVRRLLRYLRIKDRDHAPTTSKPAEGREER